MDRIRFVVDPSMQWHSLRLNPAIKLNPVNDAARPGYRVEGSMIVFKGGVTFTDSSSAASEGLLIGFLPPGMTPADDRVFPTLSPQQTDDTMLAVKFASEGEIRLFGTNISGFELEGMTFALAVDSYEFKPRYPASNGIGSWNLRTNDQGSLIFEHRGDSCKASGTVMLYCPF